MGHLTLHKAKNVGSNGLAGQQATPTVVVNVLATIRFASTSNATSGMSPSSNFITEEKLHELLKSEAERANKVVARVHFQPPYPTQITSDRLYEA